MGNITALINQANGDTVAKFDCTPFGELKASSGDVNACPFRYQGKYHDAETGLSYFGLRYYSAKLGRWISRDPLGESGGFNLYGYCGNDPVNRWDYLGLIELTPDQMEMYWNIFIKNAAEASPEQLKRMYESAQNRLLSYNYLHIKHAIGLQNTDAVKEYLARNYPGVDYSNLQTDMLMQDAFSMVYGARIRSDNRALLAASAVGSVVPVVGETMDGYVLFAPGSSIGERIVAGASLTVNVFTVGFAPNFGAPARIAGRGMHVADEVLELGLDAEKNLLQYQRALSKVEANPKVRLPKANGRWNGAPGDGFWHSDITDVNAITGGKPIQFINGRPVFTPWSRGKITFKPGQLDGSSADFDAVYDYVAAQRGLSSRNAAKNLLRELELTPHHLNNTTIELIPSRLHGNIPHIGSASDLRGGF